MVNASSTEIIDLHDRRLDQILGTGRNARGAFRSLDKDIRSDVLQLSNGESLLDQDAIKSSIFYALSGCIKRMSIDATGDTHTDEFYLQGDFFGMDSDCASVDFNMLVACGTTHVSVIPRSWSKANSDVVLAALQNELCRARNLSFYIVASETASRELSALAKSDVISVSNRRVKINNLIELRKLAALDDSSSRLGQVNSRSTGDIQ